MKFREFLLLFGSVFFLCGHASYARTVHYELEVTKNKVNLSGLKEVDFALMVNKSIPAPVLEFVEGDDAEIVVRNKIPDDELSIHWHGILLPPEMDGVSYVNTPPIFSGAEHVFRFKIRQSGTYWYHSHTNVQEQKGVYGAIVIHPKKENYKIDKDVVVVLSDWSDENANNILKNLRKDGDYYLYKKGTLRSWWGALQSHSLGNFLYNEWTRMGGMDYSDVGYDAFLINGKRSSLLTNAVKGETVRLRIINAAASTYFNVSLGQTPMKVISADGVDIKPTLANELLMGMAETYDVVFQVPENKSYELRATAQDGTGYASGWIGTGEKVLAPEKPFPDLYSKMDHSSHADHASHAEHAGHAQHANHTSHHVHSSVASLSVDDLISTRETAFPKETPIHDFKLVLDGDMSRYIWHINGKAIHQDRNIVISKGDVIRFTYENKTMMHHPMHLHGHFFRVLNKYGTLSPMKHTVDVPPHSTRVIEFLSDEPGEWMLHCHNLYHMKTGMARVVKYASFTPSQEIAHWQKHDHHLHDHLYFYGRAEAASNHAQLHLRLSQTWDQIELRTETRNTAGNNFSYQDPWEVEGDLFYRRWFDQYLSLIAGGISFDRRLSAALGVGYKLPFLIQSNLLIDHRAKIRLDLEKRFQWTSKVFTDANFVWRPGLEKNIAHAIEYEISLMYGPSWHWAAGIMLTDRNIGVGAQVQF